jgi:hypothetical protein
MAGERASRGLMLGGGLAAAAVFAAVVLLGGAAWRAWLAAAAVLAGAPTGGVVLLMMLRLIPGSWRDGLTAPLSIAPGLLPLAALAMAPILLAPGEIYAWTQQAGPGGFRQIYLTPLFFLARGAAWFALLIALALRLRRPDATAAAAVGLLLLVPSSLVITTDWLMSLDPGFASSGFGLYALSVQVCFALGLAIAGALQRPLAPRTRDVLGGVLFVALSLWAYLGFMQYLIVWADNLQPGVAWYLRRGGAWAALAWLAMGLKGAAGAALIFGQVRRDPRALAAIGLWAAAATVPEIAWLVLPAPGPGAGAGDLAIFLAAVASLGAFGLGVCRFAWVRREAAA